jgi:hypothetical protein
MGNRKETLELNIKGNAEAKLKDLEREGKKADKAIDDVGGSATKTGSSLRGAAFAAAAFGTAAVAAGKQALDTFGRIQAAQGRLQRAVEDTGGSQAEYNDILKVAKRNADQYGGSIDENITGLEVLIRQTKSSAIAQRDFALAQDIAAAENMDLLQAVEMLRKARNGEVEEIKNLNGLNKDQAEELNRVEGATRRGAMALDALTEEYSGAARELSGVNEQLGSFESNLDRLVGAGGGLLVEFGEAFGLIAERGDTEPTFLSKVVDEVELLVDAIDRADLNALEILAASPIFGGAGAANVAGQVARARSDIQDERGNAPSGTISQKTLAEREEKRRIAKEIRERDEKRFAEMRRKREEEEQREEERRAEEAKRRAVQRQKERAQAEAEALKESKSIVAEAAQEAEADLRHVQERNFRERLAQLRLQGEERRALELELQDRNATEGEAALALNKFDEEQQAAQEELRIREEIARLRLDGRDVEADLAEIRSRNLSPLEEELAIRERLAEMEEDQEDLEEKRAQARETAIEAGANAASGLIGMLAEEETARRSAAAIDALVYGYKAVAAFANPATFAQGLQYSVAAAQAGAVAAGAGGGGRDGAGSAGKASAPSSAERSAQRDERTRASLNGEREPAKTENNFYFRSVASPSPRDIRQIGQANDQSNTQRIGGQRRERRGRR